MRWLTATETYAAEELKVPGNATTETFDFGTKGIEGWTRMDGQWVVEEMTGAASGKRIEVPARR